MRFDLPEMKLAIVRCAGHSDATVIEQLWKEIIEKGLLFIVIAMLDYGK